MRPRHRNYRGTRGVTLVELVIAMVVVAIIVAATIYFVYPVRQAADVTVRAALTDTADNVLQRIRRDVRLALPNSVRVDGTGRYLEFIAVRTAGRYRSDGGEPITTTPHCPDDGHGSPDSDQLTFDSPETCFTSIGKLADAASIAVNSDYLVLNNYGLGFSGQNAYELSGNIVQITSKDTSGSSRDLISFGSSTFQRTLHDSPGKRFYVVSEAVTYGCDLSPGVQAMTRYSGYGIASTQGTPPPGATSVPLIAENVIGCEFDYRPNVSPQVGLLTLRLTLSRTLSGGEAETVSLYHAVHVSNVP